MKYNRIQEMMKVIERHQSITNQELCNLFNISIQTLHRDLKILEKDGGIIKVYGGVVYKNPTITSSIPSFETRLMTSEKEKNHIGKIAASFVKEDDVLFVDSGTTAYRMIPFLSDLKHVTVISCSLHVFQALVNMDNISCIAIGGQLNHKTSSFRIDIIDTPYQFDKAFISTVGLDEEGCTNTDLLEGKIKQHVINRSSQKFLLADHSKINTTAYNRFAKLEDFDVIITDREVPTSLNQKISQKKIKLHY